MFVWHSVREETGPSASPRHILYPRKIQTDRFLGVGGGDAPHQLGHAVSPWPGVIAKIADSRLQNLLLRGILWGHNQ